MPRYRWEHPQDWFLETASALLANPTEGNTATLRGMLVCLVSTLDDDTIQDVFQADMDEDGYFQDLDAPDPDAEEE